MYRVGDVGRFLFKRAGNDPMIVIAKVIEVRGVRLKIDFQEPGHNYRHSRWLRSPAERARFTMDPEYVFPEVRRVGAPDGNQNRRTEGRKRITLSLSVSGARLDRIAAHFHVPPDQEIDHNAATRMAFAAIDEYLDR